MQIFTMIRGFYLRWGRSSRVLSRRLTNGGIFSNKLLFKNNRILFFLLFSGNFCRADEALVEGDKVVMGDPPLGKTLSSKIISLTGLNLSVSCGGKFWIESADVFADVLFRPLHCTLGFIAIYQSKNQCQVFRAPSVFYFSDNSLILCYSSCFCLAFPLW